MQRSCLSCGFLLLLLFCFSIDSSAQEEGPFTGNFEKEKFESVVKTIEAVSDYHFYFLPKDVDSLSVTLKFENLSITQLLQRIFVNTGLKYAIDKDRNIFISKEYSLQFNLPSGFFQKEVRPDTSGNEIIPVFEKGSKKPAVGVAAENKVAIIGEKTNPNKSGKATVTGYVRDTKSGEAIVGASVYVDNASTGITTDPSGYYALTLPVGEHTIKITSTGMKEVQRKVALYADGSLNVELDDLITSLRTVVVHADRNSNVGNAIMGVNRLSSVAIKQIPALLGETDILRSVLTLPGVLSVGEGSTGFNVRGGASDQNLILFSDATVYNPSHLFGFFTAFNPDVVKGVELYKSGIPERYGGRLSSVLEVTAKEGNNKKISGVAGIGFLTSKLTIEGPLVKDKTSFVLGGRTTYSDWLLRRVPNDAYKNSKASFYDLDLHVNHSINNKNTLSVTAYTSHDQFKLNGDTLYAYGNRNANLKWKHIFNNRLHGSITVGLDQYNYNIIGNEDKIDGYEMKFEIQQKTVRTELTFAPNNKHSINMGVNAIYYDLEPGSYKPKGKQSLVIPDLLEKEQALESAVYLGDRFTVNKNFSINAGLRYSYYNYLGPQEVYNYVPGVPKGTNTIRDTSFFKGGKKIATYHTPEYRLSARYSFNDSTSVKLSFNSLRQYIHMISNTTAISPTDVWKLSDPHIKPQDGYQVSLGFYKNLKSNTIETSLELYYKRIKNYLDYKSGAELTLNHHIETDVIGTIGKAYGAELLIKKPAGKFNGWISYAYSRTWLKMDDAEAGEAINGGAYYPANFDKPHSVNFIGNYRFLHRLSASLNTVYSTGRPITLPIAIFNVGGSQGVYFSERNQYRIPDYFRVDFSVNLDGNHNIKQKTHNSWTFGVYNVLGRDNPYSVYFVQEGGRIKGYQLSIFGTQIPFITYNIRF